MTPLLKLNAVSEDVPASEAWPVDDEIAVVAVQHSMNVGGDVHANTGLRFRCGSTDVGGAVEAIHLEQGVIGVHGFVFKHIQRHRRQDTVLQCLENGGFVNDTATSAVHQVPSAHRAVRTEIGHGGDPLGVDQVMGFLG